MKPSNRLSAPVGTLLSVGFVAACFAQSPPLDSSPTAPGVPATPSAVPVSPSDVFDRVRSHNFHPLGSDRFTIDRALRKHGISNLDDLDWKVRLLAVRDLVRAGTPLTKEIVEGLKSDNLHVRSIAAMSLGILKAADAVPALQNALRTDTDLLSRKDSVGRATG